ncbi:hypothetical protein [Mesorhizobium sp. M7A.F.Ca.CA.004.04.2.1]|uniref:hypothetical protein n=1 Tax=Mesorhizobium sp. M7A.F.Ca.CA.004.04.2.1 TaxID=2496677 RepID=UPI0013E3E9A0|nr:hypothetical protein [Mesorhizobium sp. M7A.F.Ca.CA.004.04.2.1]
MEHRKPHRAPLPFHAYSSFNKRGGKAVDIVTRRRNKALDMYQEMSTYETIAESRHFAYHSRPIREASPRQG